MSESKKERRSGLGHQASTVARLVGKAEQRQRESATDGRGRAAHSGQLGRDKSGRSKATYDLPIDRQRLVREMADQEDVSQSDIVEAAVVALYNAWQADQIKLSDLREPTRSLKVMWKLNVPDELSLFSK